MLCLNSLIPVDFVPSHKNYNFLNCDCNYVVRVRALAFVFMPVTLECLRLLYQYFNANFPLFSQLGYFVITRMITDLIGFPSVLLPLLRHLFVALLTNSHSFPNIFQAFVRGHKKKKI